ncbi:MAG: 16S rRNA (uracil(1498)-N(3))-methyltransferase [Luteolibacter sp.]
MPRFFLSPDSWSEEAWLTGDEAKHLSQVMRIRAGETVTVFDGAGRRAEAAVREVVRDRVKLSLAESRTLPRMQPAMVLAIAIPKGKTMDLVVQKAVELGVAVIQPLVTRRTIVQPGDGKADKWRRVALEACKQCGSDFLPEVAEPLEFPAWLDSTSAGLRLIASLAPGAKPMREVVRIAEKTSSATVLVGPEGDFTPEETSTALLSGFLPVTLGPTVLRTETAALFALSALRYEFA